jgi:hypothetical protein
MNIFICSPKKRAVIEIMLSCVTFLKDGKYEHRITFLITNKGTDPITELLILYPCEFGNNGQDACISEIGSFNKSGMFGAHNEIEWTVVEEMDNNSESIFNFNDTRGDEYNYRGLTLHGCTYHGWMSFIPKIERQNYGLDLLGDIKPKGYSVFIHKFPQRYPLLPDMPNWARIKFVVDMNSQGWIGRLISGILGPIKNIYPFCHPDDVKNNLLQFMREKKDEGIENERAAIAELEENINPIRSRDTDISIRKHLFYLIYKDQEKDSVAPPEPLKIQSVSPQFINAPPCEAIDLSGCNISGPINVHTKEYVKINPLKILPSLIKGIFSWS